MPTSRVRFRSPLRAVLALLLALAVFPPACAPIHDLSPFLHATHAAADAVQATGRAVIHAAGRSAAGHADRLRAAWQDRDLAMAAACAYAEELQRAAARHAPAAALADSLASLSAATGIAPGPAGVAGRLAAYILNQIDRVRAARSLAEAVHHAAPVVDALVRQLALDADDLRLLVRASEQDARLSWLEQPERRAAASFLAAIHARRNEILAKDFSDLTPDQRNELLELTRLAQAAADPRTDRHLEALAADAARTQALIDASQQAVLAWAAAHRDLADALASRRPIETTALAAAILDLRRLQAPNTPETQP